MSDVRSTLFLTFSHSKSARFPPFSQTAFHLGSASLPSQLFLVVKLLLLSVLPMAFRSLSESLSLVYVVLYRVSLATTWSTYTNDTRGP